MPDNSVWVYLSPHFDDAALSCGGLAWEQARAGRVEIWTICAGIPAGIQISPFAAGLHERWIATRLTEQVAGDRTGEEIVRARQEEDEKACHILGTRQRLLSILDCIYRTAPGEPGHALYASEMALFGPLHPQEAGLVDQIAGQLMQMLPPLAEIVCPLALGNHVDHQLVRRAAEAMRKPLWYYADYPYVRLPGIDPPGDGWQPREFGITVDGMAAWEDAVAAYTSQISTFWQDEQVMRADIREYGARGVRLWRRVTELDS